MELDELETLPARAAIILQAARIVLLFSVRSLSRRWLKLIPPFARRQVAIVLVRSSASIFHRDKVSELLGVSFRTLLAT